MSGQCGAMMGGEATTHHPMMQDHEHDADDDGPDDAA
jgi:hypothetical protein